jgi:hypothetical protein
MPAVKVSRWSRQRFMKPVHELSDDPSMTYQCMLEENLSEIDEHAIPMNMQAVQYSSR